MTDALAIDEAPATKLSTPQLEDMLRAKYERQRYALLFDVPDAVSMDQKRRIDAIAVDCWASGGRVINGFELKISRADWLRELKQVDKADPFLALCDHFWLVTADPKIAKLEEIPACWGWMAATKTGLRIQRPATKLPGCGASVPRSFVIGVLRKLQDEILSSPDVRAHIEHRVKEQTQRFEERVQAATQRIRSQSERLQEKVGEFETASGIKIENNWRLGNIGELVAQLMKLHFGDGLDAVPKLLEGHANALRETLETVENVRAELERLPKREPA